MNALCRFSLQARIDFDQDSGKSGNRIASVALALGEHSLRLGAMKSVARLSPLQASPGSGLFLFRTRMARRGASPKINTGPGASELSPGDRMNDNRKT